MPLLFAPAVTVELCYLIGVIGMGLCIFWLRANKRTQERINYWQGCLARTEPPESHLLVYRVFTGREWQKLSKPPRVYAINFLPYIFISIWIIVMLVVTVVLLARFFP